MNTLFPVFLKLDSLKVLIVGGGKVGFEKLSTILKNSPGARITLVGTTISNEIKSAAVDAGSVRLAERPFTEEDLDEANVVLLATGDRQLHTGILHAAHQRGLLVNVADTPDLCDFYLGSVVSKGDLKIGISTNGKSPTLSKRIREYLEEAIPDSIQQVMDNLQSIREKVKGDFDAKVKALNEATSAWLKK